MEFEYAFLLDALLEEQAQNITIDTTQIPFKTAKRQYVIIDAPGHKEFLKNMITGAASADAAVLLIDAKEGIQEQSKRHAHLLSLLGIKQVAVAVNKMDLVDYNEEVYENICANYRIFLEKLGVTPSFFIPISAKLGEAVVNKSAAMPWYTGPSMVEALDSFEMPAPQTDLPLRFMLQDIYRFDERRILAGRTEAGKLRVGDEIAFWPDRKRSRVKSIEHWNASGPVTEVVAGYSTAITLEEQIFVERGQIGSHPDTGPAEGRELHASLFWIHNDPLPVNKPVTLKLGAQTVEGRLIEVSRVLDSQTLEPVPGTRPQIEKNEVADVRIRVRRPIAFDEIDRVSESGRFVVLYGKRIGGGGIIREADYGTPGEKGVASENITWTIGKVTREARVEQFGHRGVVIWLTGLSGSGKSTLAVGLESALHQRGYASFVLDGDNLRHGLCSDLQFSSEDRAENIRRASEVAKLMSEAGMIVICSLISPYSAERRKARDICHRDGVPFAEVFVNASLEVCEQRDPRGLYKRARAGEIKGFTGVDAPYEVPTDPELELRTDELAFEESMKRIYDFVSDLARAPQDELAEELESGAGI